MLFLVLGLKFIMFLLLFSIDRNIGLMWFINIIGSFVCWKCLLICVYFFLVSRFFSVVLFIMKAFIISGIILDMFVMFFMLILKVICLIDLKVFLVDLVRK